MVFLYAKSATKVSASSVTGAEIPYFLTKPTAHVWVLIVKVVTMTCSDKSRKEEYYEKNRQGVKT